MADLNTMLASLKGKRQKSAWFTPIDLDTGLPFGEPDAPFQIHLLSRQSDEWHAIEEAWEAVMAVRKANGSRLTVKDAEEFKQHRIRCHIAITLEWRNLSSEDGPVPCTPVTMAHLYEDRSIQAQLYRFTSIPASYGMTGPDEPETEEADAKKKSPSGVSGDSVSATA